MGNKRLMSLYYRLESVVRYVDKVELILVVSSFLFIIVVNSMEIFTRFVLSKSFFWVFEITILFANIMYFLGAALVYKRKQDIQMVYFIKFFSTKIQKKWDIMIDGVSFYFFVVIIYNGIKLLNIQSRHVSQGLGIPNHYFSLPLVVGAISMALIMSQQFLAKYLNINEGNR
ncbi:MAG: TRAP transporter small permease subunit [Candidatus Jordarchaeaceae archaeon]